jgi:hypothetical protein
MKALLIAPLLLLYATAHAQTSEEWLQQKETQKKYLLHQIAALKVYIDYAEKGYRIASKGLQTVQAIKEGDFNLHNEFFNSLKQVHPAIQQWSRVADIISIQIKIVKSAKGVLSSIKENTNFARGEIDYCQTVFDHLLAECLENIEELLLVITSGELEMKDDERIKRIETLWLEMQDKYAFFTSFSNEIKLLSVQRGEEQKEVELSRMLAE